MIPREKLFGLLGNFSGEVGLYINSLEDEEILTINENKIFPSASVIKIPILACLCQAVERRELRWDTRIRIDDVNRVGGTGILFALDQDYEPSIKVLANLMITLSDNIATNQIIDLLGMDTINAFFTAYGFKNTVLMRKMLDAEALKQGRNNYMTAGEVGKMLTDIATGKCCSEQISREILNIMEQQQCRNKLPGMVPAIPSYAADDDRIHIKKGSVLVANKTGDLIGIQHDVGIFTLPGQKRYVIAMFTGKLEKDFEGVRVISEVSRIMYEAMK